MKRTKVVSRGTDINSRLLTESVSTRGFGDITFGAILPYFVEDSALRSNLARTLLAVCSSERK